MRKYVKLVGFNPLGEKSPAFITFPYSSIISIYVNHLQMRIFRKVRLLSLRVSCSLFLFPHLCPTPEHSEFPNFLSSAGHRFAKNCNVQILHIAFSWNSPSLKTFLICLVITELARWNRSAICSCVSHTVYSSKVTFSFVRPSLVWYIMMGKSLLFIVSLFQL